MNGSGTRLLMVRRAFPGRSELHTLAGGDVMQSTTVERSRPGESMITVAAWSAIAGALLQIVLGIPLAHLQAQLPVPTTILGLNAISHLLLLVGIVGLARSGAAGRGRIAGAGIALTLLGLVVLTLAEFTAMVNMDIAVLFYGSATLAMALGLILTGVAVLRAGRWTGWQRFTPLVCGLFIPLVVIPAFALPGYASHYAIGIWGVCWLLLGLSLRGPVTGREESVMSRLTAPTSILAVLIAGLLAGGAGVSLAQEGTPPADEYAMPVGVTFDGLAFATVAFAPPGPVDLGLYRSRLEPGASVDLGGGAAYYLISVESGTITFHVDAPALVTRAIAGTPAAQTPDQTAPEEAAAGTDVVLQRGDAALFSPNPGGAGGEVRNDGQEPVIVLVVEAQPAADGMTGAASPTP